jgi:hypothetical protein
MSIHKPVSSLLPPEDCLGASFRFEVPHINVKNPVPGTATFPGIKQEHFPYTEKPDFKDENKDHMPDPPKVKSLSTKPHKTHVPRTYW